jgi:hypothetical protein
LQRERVKMTAFQHANLDGSLNAINGSEVRRLTPEFTANGKNSSVYGNNSWRTSLSNVGRVDGREVGRGERKADLTNFR